MSCEPPPTLFVFEPFAQGPAHAFEGLDNLRLGYRFPRASREKGKCARRKVKSESQRPNQRGLIKGRVVGARLQRRVAREGRRRPLAAKAPPVAPNREGLGSVLDAAKWAQTCFEVSSMRIDLKRIREDSISLNTKKKRRR